MPEELPVDPLVLSEPVVPEPVALPEPRLPELEPLPDVVLLGEDDVPPADDEPDAPCSRRQRSFSAPVMLSHWVMLVPTLGVVDEELPLALGRELELEPPVDEESLPVALWLPTLDPDGLVEDCA